MAVKIRLTRVGATKRPSYRVVAIDSRKPRDGRALEILGFYDPLTDPATVQLDGARVQEWIAKGAKPSETVVKLMRQAGVGQAANEATKEPAKEPAKKPAAKSASKPRTRKAAAPAAATAEE